MTLTQGRTPSKENKEEAVQSTLEPQRMPKIDMPVATLSSKGLSYPDNIKISYDSYSYGDLLYYNDSQLSEHSKLDFIASGISVEPIGINDMTYWDVMFIGMLRNLSRGNVQDASVTFSCPDCNKKQMQKIDVSTLEFSDLTIPKLPIYTTIKGAGVGAGVETTRKIKFMPMTYGDYLQLLDKELNTDPVAIFASQIKDIPLEEAMQIVNTAFDDDSLKFEKIDEFLYHGPVPIEVECMYCSFVFMIDPIDENVLIRPFRTTNFVEGGEIHFG